MFTRLLQYAINNIFRNTFLSFSSVLVLTLLMFFINILVILYSVSNNVIADISGKLSLSLYLEDDYNQDSIEYNDLRSDIIEAYPNISLVYKNKLQVLEDLRAQDPELVKILETTNPLPETIQISNIALDDYVGLNTIIESKSFILKQNQEDDTYFANYSVQYQKVADVINRLQIVQAGLYIVIAIFVLSIAIIIYSVIGNFVYYFRDEIYISRLVWWAREFIYGPFVLQGMIYAALAFIASFLIFLVLMGNMELLLWGIYDGEISLPIANIVFILQFFLFISIGGLSGYISSKKYIK